MTTFGYNFWLLFVIFRFLDIVKEEDAKEGGSVRLGGEMILLGRGGLLG